MLRASSRRSRSAPQPRGVAVNTTLNRAYVANNGANTLSIIDGLTNAVLLSPAVGTSPRGVAVLPGLNRVYVANQSAGTVSVLDSTTGGLVTTITVGDQPWESPPIRSRIPCT